MVIKVTGLLNGILRSTDNQVMVNTGNGYSSAAELGIDPISVIIPTRFGPNGKQEIMTDRGYIAMAAGDTIIGAAQSMPTAASGLPALVMPSGDVYNLALPKRVANITAFAPFRGTNVMTAVKLTQNELRTAPCAFVAVAPIFMNADVNNAMVINSCSVAVTERTDTVASKTQPIINGVTYNAMAAAGTQLGFVPVFTSALTVPAATTMTRTINGSSKSTTIESYAMGAWAPLQSVPRVDGKPLFAHHFRFDIDIANTPTLTVASLPTSADFDTLNTLMAPHEFYPRSQAAITSAQNPALMTTPSATQNCRLWGVAYKTLEGQILLVTTGDSIDQGLGAGGFGDINTFTAAFAAGGYWCRSVLAMAAAGKSIGFVNLALAGSFHEGLIQRLNNFAAIVKPTHAVAPYYTPNDVMDAATLSACYVRMADQQNTATLAGYNFSGRLPVPYKFGNETLRQSMISRVSAIKGNAFFNPNVTGVYDPTNAANYYWVGPAANTDVTIDGTHPGPASQPLISAALVPALLAWLF